MRRSPTLRPHGSPRWGSALLLGLLVAFTVGLCSATVYAHTGMKDAGHSRDAASNEDATHIDDGGLVADGGSREDASQPIDDGGLVADGGGREDASQPIDDGGILVDAGSDEKSKSTNSSRNSGGCSLSPGRTPGMLALLLAALVLFRLESRSRPDET